MATKAPPIVRANDGRLGTILEETSEKAHNPEGTVDLLFEDGERRIVPSSSLVEQADGTFALDLSRLATAAHSEVVVPLVAETVEVGKRTVETGKVRIRKTVKATERVVDEPVFEETVEVERVAINRPIPEAIGPRQEGDTLIVPLLEEVLVVEKRLILREEVRITRRRVERRNPQTVILRSEEAEVERSGTGR